MIETVVDIFIDAMDILSNDQAILIECKNCDGLHITTVEEVKNSAELICECEAPLKLNKITMKGG